MPPPRTPASPIDSRPIVQWQADGPPRRRSDALAVEEPLEIQVESRSISITMRTPGHDEELAAGFLLSEQLLKHRNDLVAIRPYPRNAHGNALNVFLHKDVTVDLASLTRHVFASSSCGLCGKASIDNIQRQFDRIRSPIRIAPEILLALSERMRTRQSAFDATGGIHAAALFDAQGELLVLREDVGRHNAVDKVLGHAFLQGWIPLADKILLVSGRASFEIVQKALAGGIPIVCAISAPSTLAVDLAQSGGITLVGFLRENRFNIYSQSRRIATRSAGRSKIRLP